jgi:hypothetical protein
MSTTSQTRSTAYMVMQRIFDEGFATGDGSVADELCSPELLDHQFGTAGHGADAVVHVRDAMRDVHGRTASRRSPRPGCSTGWRPDQRDRTAGRMAGGSCLARRARATTMVRRAFGSTGGG